MKRWLLFFLIVSLLLFSFAFAEEKEILAGVAFGTVNEEILFPVSRNGLDYTMKVHVDDFYRGSAYTNLVGIHALTAKPGNECMAVKVTIKFESIDRIDKSILGTADPEIVVHYLAKFDALSCVGEDYGFVYSILGMEELDACLHVGESATGYLQFEVSKDDPAPLLVYKPELDHQLYIELR